MRMIGFAVAASAALVAAYLALGGASYAPAKVADPCAQRDWRDPSGFQEVAEQIILSSVDGAACELGVSREEVVLAFANRDSLQRFAREQGIGTDELEMLARSGLARAIADAELAGALDPSRADQIRGLVRRIPIAELLDLIELLPGL
jgi:hypothetical protein